MVRSHEKAAHATLRGVSYSPGCAPRFGRADSGRHGSRPGGKGERQRNHGGGGTEAAVATISSPPSRTRRRSTPDPAAVEAPLPPEATPARPTAKAATLRNAAPGPPGPHHTLAAAHGGARRPRQHGPRRHGRPTPLVRAAATMPLHRDRDDEGVKTEEILPP